MECHTYDLRQAGDHDIVVGEVAELEIAVPPLLEPLLYYRRGYRTLGEAGDRG
jgi:flavin reductase (DIM6/NTAB) family NADH-FMN oxidoreductase RutF